MSIESRWHHAVLTDFKRLIRRFSTHCVENCRHDGEDVRKSHAPRTELSLYYCSLKPQRFFTHRVRNSSDQRQRREGVSAC